MKFNWGTGIVLAFIGFIGFILYFVILASTGKNSDHHLVTEDYYQEELAYQKEIDAETNAKNVAQGFRTRKNEEGLLIEVPEELRLKDLKGTLSLYRPSNKHLDFDLDISLSNSHLLIPDNRLLDGRWDIKLRWSEKDKNYLVKKSITY
ncbi:MAG: FixH family protein [Flavobacteriaceae bacterium]